MTEFIIIITETPLKLVILWILKRFLNFNEFTELPRFGDSDWIKLRRNTKVPIAERKQNVTKCSEQKSFTSCSAFVSAFWKRQMIGQVKCKKCQKKHCGVMKVQNCESQNFWQRETTQTWHIGIFSAFGELNYIKFLSISINQVNCK